MHIGGLLVFKRQPEIDGRPGVDGIVDVLERRLPLLPRCRQRLLRLPLGMGQPVWVDDPHFDIRRHVRHGRLAPPGTRRQLLDLVGRIHARPLDRSLPLWQLHIIEGLKEGRLAVYIKLHHAMADGASAIELGLALFDLDAAGEALAPITTGEVVTGLADPRMLMAETARRTAGAMLRRAEALLKHPPRLRQGIASAVSLRDVRGLLRPAPAGPLNFRVSGGRRVEVVALPLGRAKEIKNRLGGTVNDVALTAVAEAIHQFLAHRSRPSDGVRYRVMVPVSKRTDQEKRTMGNRLSGMFIDLPVGPMNPARRLWTISQMMGGLKQQRQADAATYLVEIASLTPPPMAALAMRLSARNQRIINLVVSNVPGVQAPIFCAGSRLEEIYPLLPLAPNTGLVICVLSYNNVLHFGLVGDDQGLGDLDVLADGLRQGFRRLQHAAAGRGRPRQGAAQLTAVHYNGGRSQAATASADATSANGVEMPARAPTMRRTKEPVG